MQIRFQGAEPLSDRLQTMTKRMMTLRKVKDGLLEVKEGEQEPYPGSARCRYLVVSTFSGISIENPDRPARTGGLNSVRDILRKAAEYVI